MAKAMRLVVIGRYQDGVLSFFCRVRDRGFIVDVYS